MKLFDHDVLLYVVTSLYPAGGSAARAGAAGASATSAAAIAAARSPDGAARRSARICMGPV